MAIDITYKGNSLASFGSGTKTMKTEGKYMEDDVTITVPSGSATTPATTVTANPTISVSSGGLITATASATKSVTPSVSAGWVASGTAGTITVSGSNTSQLSTQAGKTVTPTTSEQTAVASGKYTTGAIKVAAMPSGTAGTPNIQLGSISNHVATLYPWVQNTTGYITGGTKTGSAYTISASQLTSGTKSITENGTGIDVTNYSSVDVNVPVPEPGGTTKKRINFVDYDGTILYSYWGDEWENVTSLPSNPSHEDEGLTAQGWNWTKAQIDNQLSNALDDTIWVGQMYVTYDGITQIYILLPEGRTHPYLGIGISGTVEVDWGDWSDPEELTGSSTSTVVYAGHEYDSSGEYIINISVSSGSFVFFGTSSSSHILKKSDNTTASVNRVYTNAVQKVRLGNSAGIGSYAFHYCTSLESITIPNTVTSIGTGAFASCYALKSITVPSGTTSIGIYTFSGCYSLATVSLPSGMTSVGVDAFNYCSSLEEITLPNSLTSLGNGAFSYCYSLKKVGLATEVEDLWNNVFANCPSLEYVTINDWVSTINSNAFDGCYSIQDIYISWAVTTIGDYAFRNCYSLSAVLVPDSVESIGTGAFSGCYGVGEYHFWGTTPPTLGTNAFQYIQSDCKIYVPAESVTAYKTATNWSAYASYIEAEPSGE